jgi:hypothetical protein
MAKKTTPEERQLETPPRVAPQELAANDLALTLDVEPRKPRLAWQSMERKEMAGRCRRR